MNFLKIIGVLSILLMPSNVFADSDLRADHETNPQQPQQQQGQRCGKRKDIVKSLSTGDFKETEKMIGLVAGGKTVLEIWSNKATGTWTALITQTDGTSCLAALGPALLIISEEDQVGQKIKFK